MKMCLWLGVSLLVMMMGVASVLVSTQIDFPEPGVVDTLIANDIAWSPNGEYIATSHQGGFSLWDGETGALVGRYPTISATSPDYPNYILSMAWKPDGTQLAIELGYSFDSDSIIQVISIPSGEIVLDGINGGVHIGLDWSPDNQRFAFPYAHFANENGSIYIYDVTSGEVDQILSSIEGIMLNQVRWSHDGNKIASAFETYDEAGIIIWDILSGTQITTLNHEDTVYDFDWSFDGTHIVSSTINVERDTAATIWDVNTGEIIRTLDVIPAFNLEWSPTEDVIAIESNGYITLVDARSGTLLNQLSQRVRYLSWNPDGSILATMSGSTPMFFTRDGQELPPFPLMVGYNITNIQTNEPIRRVYDNDTIDLAGLEDIEDLVIQAFPNRAPIQSVSLELNGVVTIFNEPPYILPLPSVGTYTLTGIPYSEPDVQGLEGTPLTITFEIVDSGGE